MLGYTFWGAAILTLVTVILSNAVSIIEHAYAARYTREIYLTAKTKRKLMEDKRDLLAQVRNPEWEPVEEGSEDTE